MKTLAAVPLKATAVAPVRSLPVMVTEVPIGPEAGRKLVTVGAGVEPVVNVTSAPYVVVGYQVLIEFVA